MLKKNYLVFAWNSYLFIHLFIYAKSVNPTSTWNGAWKYAFSQAPWWFWCTPRVGKPTFRIIYMEHLQIFLGTTKKNGMSNPKAVNPNLWSLSQCFSNISDCKNFSGMFNKVTGSQAPSLGNSDFVAWQSQGGEWYLHFFLFIQRYLLKYYL